MKLGVFDSGLGGLLIGKAIKKHMSGLDIVYLGDTLHVPYGNRSTDFIFNSCCSAASFLFQQDCKLIIIACNTASAAALRKLQQEFLPFHYPDRNILGVVVPTIEVAAEMDFDRIGLIGTNFIINSKVYEDELKKINKDIQFFQNAAPLLVPLIENDGEEWLEPVLQAYLKPLLAKKIEALILGCTHYAVLKNTIQKIVGGDIKVISQDDIIPEKLEDYLQNHPEIDDVITKNGLQDFYVTDITDSYTQAARKIYESNIIIKKVEI